MKFCKDCEHVLEDKAQDPRSGRIMTMYFCKHGDCLDPVSGEPMPCGAVRKDGMFCGLIAKYYQKKEEKQLAPVIQLVKE